MHLHVALLLLAGLLPSTLAVFADDACHTDWHHALLGVPQAHAVFFHRPQSSSKASLLYSLSEKHILGAVNPRDGSLVWRQPVAPLGNITTGFIRAINPSNTIISAVGNELKAWDALDGKLVWDIQFDYGEAKDLEIIEMEDLAGTKDVIALWADNAGGVVRKLKGDSGAMIWEHSDDSSSIPLQVSTSATNAFYVSLKSGTLGGGYKIVITTLDLSSGRRIEQNTLHSEKEISSPEQVIFVGGNSASPIIAWTDKDMKILKLNILGSRHIETLGIKQTNGEKMEKVTIHAPHKVESVPHFLVHYQTSDSNWAEVYHIDLVASKFEKAYDLPKLFGRAGFSISTQDANVFFTRNTGEETILVSSASHGILGRWTVQRKSRSSALSEEFVYPLHAVTEVVARSDSTYSVRSALTLSSGDWELIRNGEPVWKRSEDLATAVAAVIAELGEKESLAHELEVEVHQNIFAAYIHRVKRHIGDLKYLPGWLNAIPARLLASFTNSESSGSVDSGMHRDNFGFRKLIIIATESGRLHALDTAHSGRIVWTTVGSKSSSDGKQWDIKGMHVQDKTKTVKILGSDGASLVVDILTGKITSESDAVALDISTSGIIQDISGNSWIVGTTSDGNPVFPGNGVSTSGVVNLVVSSQDGSLRGLQVPDTHISTNPVHTWKFTPKEGDHVTSITHRPLHDPVASIGRVLGDRSVLYKYLNPSSILITTVSSKDSTATVYLLHAVSGAIIYSVTHKGIDTSHPIVSAMSENWLAYTFRSDSSDAADPESKSYQLVVADLYESPVPNDRGPLGSASNYSAVSPSTSAAGSVVKPFVVSQAYIIPEPISAMLATQTRQGITTKDLVCILPNSNGIVAIPRYVIDPRRPVGREPNTAEKEEGLIKYSPVLDFDPKWIITHKREVLGVKALAVQPAILESTSLVFAYGLDLFETRIAPSMEFDKLGKGFNRLQLVGTVVALGFGVAFLRPMVRRKQINARWEVNS